jgi:hypothetical protein
MAISKRWSEPINSNSPHHGQKTRQTRQSSDGHRVFTIRLFQDARFADENEAPEEATAS